ncbi:hypothetical protein NXS19_012105 [Fusarium pseudograminearum]|nr:hypothetical protein NXS19_012105 [Fusarium pseudograminearum]
MSITSRLPLSNDLTFVSTGIDDYRPNHLWPILLEIQVQVQHRDEDPRAWAARPLLPAFPFTHRPLTRHENNRKMGDPNAVKYASAGTWFKSSSNLLMSRGSGR